MGSNERFGLYTLDFGLCVKCILIIKKQKMKKIVLFICLVCAAALGYGQGSRVNQVMTVQKYAAGVITNVSVNDTTTNTDTSNLFTGAVLGWNVGVQWVVKNVTGTTGGTVIYQGSNDNVNWYAVMTDTVICNSCLATVTVSGLTGAATTVKAALFKGFPFYYLRARYITSGTQTSYITGKITQYGAYVNNLN